MGNETSKKKKGNTKPISKEAETYYKNVSVANDGQDANEKEKIQLNIAFRNAEKKSYGVTILLSNFDNKNYKQIGFTKSGEPNEAGEIKFDVSFILDYYFERQQFLLFKITRSGTENFQIESTLGAIMGSRGQTAVKKISEYNSENLVISATTLLNNNINVNMAVFGEAPTFQGKNNNIFYMVKKSRTENINDLISVYKSEVIPVAPNSKFIFNPVKAPSFALCNGNFDTALVMEFHDATHKTSLGRKDTSINKLLGPDANFKLSEGFNVGVKCDLVKEYTFIDYLRGGLQISLSIGIDFTGSNGNVQSSTSLHYANPSSLNKYERAIRACGDILSYYDYDQRFPVYGYGAVLPGTNTVNHSFPVTAINGINDPEIQSIDGVLLTYRSILPKIVLSGPTYFAPLIKGVISNIQFNNKPMVYNILLILTDGMINDMDATIDAIVEASFLPLSIIIIGIGTADFSSMDNLDCDNGKLSDRNGKKAIRDIVQFVPFYKFENDPNKLAEQVLEEIPSQVTGYFRSINTPPGDPIII